MYFLLFLDWVKSCGYVKLRFQAKTSFTNLCWFFKNLQSGTKSSKSKKPKWQDIQKSENSGIAKTIKLAKLLVLGVKRVLSLVSIPLYCNLPCCTN